MTLRLPSHISFCSVGARLVFLDTRRDRYFMLTATDMALFNAAIGRVGVAPDPAALSRLRGLGVLARDDEGGNPAIATFIEIPKSSLLDHLQRRSVPNVATLIEVAARLLMISYSLRRGRLHALIDRLRNRKTRPAARAISNSANDRRWIEAFLSARRVAPTRPSCLLDTLALADFLARRGCHATMVMGVKLDPFAAHCWLQSDMEILNDTHENAAAFTSILAI